MNTAVVGFHYQISTWKVDAEGLVLLYPLKCMFGLANTSPQMLGLRLILLNQATVKKFGRPSTIEPTRTTGFGKGDPPESISIFVMIGSQQLNPEYVQPLNCPCKQIAGITREDRLASWQRLQ